MASYLLFFPNKSGCSHKMLVDAGLSELLKDSEQGPEFMDIDQGPSGGRGVMVMWRHEDSARNPSFRIHDGQKWSQAPSLSDDLPRGRYWIGVEKDNPPQPMELVRPSPVGGLKVTLADGYAWTVPTVSRMPNSYQVQDGGEISRVCKEEYAEFYKLGMIVAGQVLEEFAKIEEVRDGMDLDDYSIDVAARDGMKLVAAALSLNYRLNWEICFLLELLDERSGALALMTFCELTEIRETIVEKKKVKHVSIRVGSYS